MDTKQRSQQPDGARQPQTQPQKEQQSPQQQGQKDPKQGQQQPRSPLLNWINWIGLAVLVIWNILIFLPQGQPSSTTIAYSTFLAQVQSGNVQQVSIQGTDIK